MANPHPALLLRSLVTLGFSTQASTRCSFTKRARRHGGRVVGHHGSIASSLGSGVRALSARSLALSDALHSSPVPAPTSLSPSASLTASSLAFRVQRRSAREHPLLGPQVAVAARRHRRRCRLAEGCSGRGRPAVRPHRGRWVEEAAAALRPPQPPLAAPSAPLALRRSTHDPRQPRGRPDADRRASLSQAVARL